MGPHRRIGNPHAGAKALEERGLLTGVPVPRGAARQDAQNMDRDSDQRLRWEVDDKQRPSPNIIDLVQEAEKNLGQCE